MLLSVQRTSSLRNILARLRPQGTGRFRYFCCAASRDRRKVVFLGTPEVGRGALFARSSTAWRLGDRAIHLVQVSAEALQELLKAASAPHSTFQVALQDTDAESLTKLTYCKRGADLKALMRC